NVATYKVYRYSSQIDTTTTTSYADTGLAPLTTYPYSVTAFDVNGKQIAKSSQVSATTLADTTPPSVPTGLVGTAVSSSQVNLSWTASTDPDSAVAGYRIYRNGSQVGTSTTTSFFGTGLSPSTSYSYAVAAYDPAGNLSAPSSSVTVTTSADSTA